MPRMRVRAAVTQLTLPLPEVPKLRVRAQQLALPLPEPVKPQSQFDADLEATRSGSMPFALFVERHKRLVQALARPWRHRCTVVVSLEDLGQELFLEIWQAMVDWDASRGVPLAAYVRKMIHWKLLGSTKKLVRARKNDIKFLQQQIIEEKVLMLRPNAIEMNHGTDYVTRVEYEAVSPEFDSYEVDAPRIARRVVGLLPPKQARVIAGVLGGESPDTMTQRVYGSKCKGQRKAALRAISAAAALVRSSS